MIPIKDDIPSNHFPYITITIIVINLLVFLLQLSWGNSVQGLNAAFGATPYEITHLVDLPPYFPFPIVFTLFTSMFLHGGVLHLLGNMLYLWIFGDNVEDAMGSVRFLLFYLICGVIASIAHIGFYPDSRVPMIGASGAISGVLGAYLLLYPRARVVTVLFIFYFIRIVKLPAVVLLTLWIAFQFFSGTFSHFAGAGQSGVAWFAHIGGFGAGMAMVSLFKKRRVRLGILHW